VAPDNRTAAELAPAGQDVPDAVQDLQRRAEQIRAEMGGPHRVESVHAAGKLTVRERLAGLLDPGSFREIGTFAHSERPEDAAVTPGDGKIGGWGAVDGRPVVAAGDDVTVKRASSSAAGGRKLKRLYESALRDGVPFIFFGETGGARIPDMMGSAGFASIGPLIYPSTRRRRMPMVTVIVGDSFGASSFLAAMSDLVVQVAGSCLAVSSPRVIEAATGDQITMEELGGVEVHSRTTGQIDLVAADEPASWDLVRQFLSYLPSSSSGPPPRAVPADPDPAIDVATVVPAQRRRGYDMRRLLRGLVDSDSLLELKPLFARSLITALARIDGWPVGVLASQPLQQAGILTPEACDKASRMICLCDAFGLPLVFLHDTPGFMIGRQVEHNRLLNRAMLMQQAVVMAGVPRLTVIVRKSYGLADHAMSGIGLGSDLLVSWPGAEISFMDPDPAASVLTPAGDQAEGDRGRAATVDRVTMDVSPYGAAAAMHVDEVIEPAATRSVLAEALRRSSLRPFVPGTQRPLSSWPVSF
jgi:acetyl-CoA carboxylase carboxyltransferase component